MPKGELGDSHPHAHDIFLYSSLYNLFNPDLAVSCVADKQVSHCEYAYVVAFCCVSCKSLSCIGYSMFYVGY